MANIFISGIEIMEDDLPNKLSWDDAQAYVSTIGENWRLPNTNEFLIIYKLYKLTIGGFKPHRYWANEGSGQVGWYHDLRVGFSPHLLNKTELHYVRLVRNA
jgi:hypothetical protein